MRRLTAVLMAALLAVPVFGDGTITTPANVSPASWKIANVTMVNGASTDIASITITVYYFDASNALVSSSIIALSGSEFTSFFTVTNSPVAGESGSAIKKYRMRVSKWLIDNGKITNVTPES